MGAMNPLNFLKSAVWRTAFAMRETGQALERLGCRMQGIYSYEEIMNRHTSVAPVKFDTPKLGEQAFVAPSGLVVGNVTLGNKSSVWYNAIIRGDRQPVTIGENSNIQDNAYVGAVSEFSPPVKIGDNVSVGHAAVLKGCKIGNNTLIGIGAVISEGVEVGAGSIVAAGAYLEEGTIVPAGEVWAGNPAKKLRDVKESEAKYLKNLPGRYVDMSSQHKEVLDLIRAKQEDYFH